MNIFQIPLATLHTKQVCRSRFVGVINRFSEMTASYPVGDVQKMSTTWLPCFFFLPTIFKRSKISSDMTTPEPEYEQETPHHSDSDSESAVADHSVDAPPKPFDRDTVARIITRLSRRWNQDEKAKVAIANFSKACEADHAIYAKEAASIEEPESDNPEAEEDESEEPESDEETRQVRVSSFCFLTFPAIHLFDRNL